VRYVVVLTGNAVLLRLAEPALQLARTRVQATGLSQQVWTEGPYCSKSWPHERAGGARRARGSSTATSTRMRSAAR
jgi:hypothetical protein